MKKNECLDVRVDGTRLGRNSWCGFGVSSLVTCKSSGNSCVGKQSTDG